MGRSAIKPDHRDRSPTPGCRLPGAFRGSSHARALAAILDAVAARDPVIIVAGEDGVGKTTLLQAAIAELRSRSAEVRELEGTRGIAPTPVRLLKQMLCALGEHTATAGPDELFRSLIEAHYAGADPVFVLDNAELLTDHALDYLGLVSGFAYAGKPLLSLILAGPPEFTGRLTAPLATRSVQIGLAPMPEDEARGFVTDRLRCRAGRDPPPLSEPALLEVLQRGGGNPARLIRNLDQHLTAAQPRVASAMVADALASARPSIRITAPDPERRREMSARPLRAPAVPYRATESPPLTPVAQPGMRVVPLACLAGALAVAIGAAKLLSPMVDHPHPVPVTSDGDGLQAAAPPSDDVDDVNTAPAPMAPTTSLPPWQATPDDPGQHASTPGEPSKTAAASGEAGAEGNAPAVPTEPWARAPEQNAAAVMPPSPPAPAAGNSDPEQQPPITASQQAPIASMAPQASVPGQAAASATTPSPSASAATNSDPEQRPPVAPSQQAPAASIEPQASVPDQGAAALMTPPSQAPLMGDTEAKQVQPSAAAIQTENSATAQPPVPASQAPTPQPPAPKLSPDTLANLLKIGDAKLSLGDISAARLLFTRAANGGSAQAATKIGQTYDPDFLARAGATGMRPDRDIAAEWYRTAAAMGDAEAAARLKQLNVTTAGK